MGLDITAYAGLQFVEIVSDDDYEAWEEEQSENVNLVRFYLVGPFDKAAENIKDHGVYKYNESLNFRAGSYSGYSLWRRTLAHMLGTTPEIVWHDPKPMPFLELINFSDCEGVIGTEYCLKLALDFIKWQPTIDGNQQLDNFFREQYAKWRKAFELASQDGAVKFH